MSREEQFKVTLGKYKGLSIKRPEAEPVSEEELQQACEQQKRAFAQPIDAENRPVQNGDIATIDFTGYCDGEAFDGGSGTDYPLEIGSGTFIPGFEEQIVGAEAGKEIDVNVTFPADYGAPNLAGKEALFKVVVKKIQEVHLPELEIGVVENIRVQLKQRNEMMTEDSYENMLIAAIVEHSEMEIPQEMYNLEAQNALNEWKALMQMRGMDFNSYYEMTGLDDSNMVEQLMDQAKIRLQSRLALEAIAQKEGFDAEEADIEAQLEELAAAYKMTIDDIRTRMVDNEDNYEAMKSDIRMRKAIALVKENVEK